MHVLMHVPMPSARGPAESRGPGYHAGYGASKVAVVHLVKFAFGPRPADHVLGQQRA